MTQRSTERAAKDPATFEQALARVEQIIERIESGQAGLDESLADYESGIKLIEFCRSKLESAQQRVDDLTQRLASAPEADPQPNPENAVP